MFREALQILKAKVTKNNKIKFILRKVFNFILFIIRFINIPAVVIISILKDELHMINFYIDRHIIKPLNIYRYKNNLVKRISKSIDLEAYKICGEHHEIYSGATAPEVATGFDICIEILSKNTKNIDYLEIGSANGKSMGLIGSLIVARNMSFKGVSLDPYFDDAYEEGADQPDRFLFNKKKLKAPISISNRNNAIKLWSRLELNVNQIRKTSCKGLEELAKQKSKFDLVYIDGLHDGMTPITDFISCLKMTNVNGIIILDDRHWVNIHHLRKICDNNPSLKKVYENWKISGYQLVRPDDYLK